MGAKGSGRRGASRKGAGGGMSREDKSPAEIAIGAAGPPPKGPPVEVHGNVQQATLGKLEAASRDIPDSVWAKLKEHGTTAEIVEEIGQKYPELADLTPRGYNGASFRSARGFYTPDTKKVSLFDKIEDPGTRTLSTSYGLENTFKHEMGHAYDHSWGRPSRAGTFRTAYDEDVKNITSPTTRSEYSYFLQPGDAGPSEAWAELFANHHKATRYPNIKATFPRAYQALRGYL